MTSVLPVELARLAGAHSVRPRLRADAAGRAWADTGSDPFISASAARWRTSSGPSHSGKPCPRLIAPGLAREAGHDIKDRIAERRVDRIHAPTGSRNGRTCFSDGILPRTSSTFDRSSVAEYDARINTTLGEISPQGSMISEWPNVSRPSWCLPPCAGRDDIAARLDGPRAQQRMPVRLARDLREGGGHGDDLRPSHRELPEQIREAHIIADRQAQLRRREEFATIGAAAPGRIAVGLLVDVACIQLHVEHVDLVVARR